VGWNGAWRRPGAGCTGASEQGARVTHGHEVWPSLARAGPARSPPAMASPRGGCEVRRRATSSRTGEPTFRAAPEQRKRAGGRQASPARAGPPGVPRPAVQPEHRAGVRRLGPPLRGIPRPAAPRRTPRGRARRFPDAPRDGPEREHLHTEPGRQRSAVPVPGGAPATHDPARGRGPTRPPPPRPRRPEPTGGDGRPDGADRHEATRGRSMDPDSG
jgi:hypothetical protein